MMSLKELEQEQLELAKKVVKQDSVPELELIGGIETGFKFNKLFCTVVVCKYSDMSLVEKQSVVEDCRLPYIPGFRAQRDLDVMIRVYKGLKQKPGVLLVKGSGILHPRRLGLASHLGVKLNTATIGITKKLLCGETRGENVILENEVVGKLVVTKEKAKPIIISIGHKLSLDASVEVVKKCIRPPHKMPEPLHLAHKFVRKRMKKY